jgi:hypothetical protein
MASSSASSRALYGGAICALLDGRFRDVSDLRDVPDNQEVFVDSHSEASVIVELLEIEADLSNENALSHHFNELARANETQEVTILSQCCDMPDHFMPGIGPTRPRLALIGKQYVQKHRTPSAPVDIVYIILVLVRLENVGTDVLFTLNFPLSNRSSLSENDLLAIEQSLHTSMLLPEGTDSCEVAKDQIYAFRRFLDSFQIADWSLFL